MGHEHGSEAKLAALEISLIFLEVQNFDRALRFKDTMGN